MKQYYLYAKWIIFQQSIYRWKSFLGVQIAENWDFLLYVETVVNSESFQVRLFECKCRVHAWVRSLVSVSFHCMKCVSLNAHSIVTEPAQFGIVSRGHTLFRKRGKGNLMELCKWVPWNNHCDIYQCHRTWTLPVSSSGDRSFCPKGISSWLPQGKNFPCTGRVGSSKGLKPVVMRWLKRALPWRPVFFEHISQRNSNSLCHNCLTHLSHKCPIPIFHYVLTSHAWGCHMVPPL